MDNKCSSGRLHDFHHKKAATAFRLQQLWVSKKIRFYSMQITMPLPKGRVTC